MEQPETNDRIIRFILISYFHKNTPVSSNDGCLIYIHDFFDSKKQLNTFVEKRLKNQLVFPKVPEDSPLYGKKWDSVPLICVQNNRFYLLASSDLSDEIRHDKIMSMLEHYKMKDNFSFFDDLEQYTYNEKNKPINQSFKPTPYAMVYMMEDPEHSEQETISNKQNAIVFISSFPNQKDCLEQIEQMQDTTSSLYDKTTHTGLRCVPMRKWFWCNTYCIDYHDIMQLPQYNTTIKSERPSNLKSMYDGTNNVFTDPASRAIIKKYIEESEKKNLKSNQDFLKMNNEAIKHKHEQDVKVEQIENIIEKVLGWMDVSFVQDFVENKK